MKDNEPHLEYTARLLLSDEISEISITVLKMGWGRTGLF